MKSDFFGWYLFHRYRHKKKLLTSSIKHTRRYNHKCWYRNFDTEWLMLRMHKGPTRGPSSRPHTVIPYTWCRIVWITWFSATWCIKSMHQLGAPTRCVNTRRTSTRCVDSVRKHLLCVSSVRQLGAATRCCDSMHQLDASTLCINSVHPLGP